MAISSFVTDTTRFISVDDLKRLARLFTNKPETTKDRLMAYLTGLLDGTQLAATVRALDPAEQRILASVAHGAGLLRSDRLRQVGLTVPELGGWQQRSYGVKPTISRLLLFFPNGFSLEPGLQQRLRVLLANPNPPPPALALLGEEPAGPVDTWDFERASEVVLEQARQGEVLLPDFNSDKAMLQALARSSGSSGDKALDRARCRHLLDFLMMAKVLTIEAIHLVPGKDADIPGAVAKSFAGWRDSQAEECVHLPQVKGIEYSWPLPSVPRRMALLAEIAKLPVDRWVATADFLAHLDVCQVPVDVYAQTEREVYLGRRSHENSLSELGNPALDWIRDAWVRLVIGEILSTLGLVEIRIGDPPLIQVGESREAYTYGDLPKKLGPSDVVSAFRLTARGAWLLGVGPEPRVVAVPSGGVAWRIQPDGTVVCLAAKVPARERIFLDGLADPVDERSWRLTRAKLMAALAGGMTETELRKRLGLFADPLPSTVAVLVDDAVRRTTAVVVSAPIHLLTFTDDHLYQTLVHHRKTKDLVIDLGSRRLAVSPLHLTALRKVAKSLDWHLPNPTFTP